MFKFGKRYSNLKKDVKLATLRLNLLQAKRLEQNEILKLEIASYLKDKKYLQAEINAFKLISNETSVEAMKLMKKYCETILKNYDLFVERSLPDLTLKGPISSLIWISRYYPTIPELQKITKQVALKYGPDFNAMALNNGEKTVDPDLIRLFEMLPPSDKTVQNYLENMCFECGITYDNRKECVNSSLTVVKNAIGVSAAVNPEDEHSGLNIETEFLANNSIENNLILSTKNDFVPECMFQTKLSKSLRKMSHENISNPSLDSGIFTDDVSISFGFEAQENDHRSLEISSLISEENQNVNNKAIFSSYDDIKEINKSKNYISDNSNTEYRSKNKNMGEIYFNSTEPPSKKIASKVIIALKAMYQEPPPPSSSLDLNYIKSTSDFDQTSDECGFR